jgi:APA family basic amino acid/polyamine antiporter
VSPQLSDQPTVSKSEISTADGAATRGRLLQVLGMWFGIAAAVGNTIAAGIVRVPGDIARLLPEPIMYMSVWVIGGLYALFGASSLAELGAAIPRSGGQYNFSRRAMGDYAGFIVGWSDWLSSCGAVAAVSIVVGEYLAKLLPWLSGFEKPVALACLIGFALLQWRGIAWGSAAQLLTAGLKTGAFIILVVACFLFGKHGIIFAGAPAPAAATATTASPVAPSGWLLMVALMLGLQSVVYTIDGWNGIIYFGEEVSDPGRDVPRAIFGSVFSIMAIYILLNAALLYVLPMNEIVDNKFALGTAAQHIFGQLGDPIIRSIMIVSFLSCINAIQLFTSRVLYSMSCDGLFSRRFSSVNKGGTPELALLLSTVVSVLFILGSFERLVAMLSFFFVANYTLSYTSLFLLRKNEPDLPRPYRAWGYPIVPALALVGSVCFLVASIVTDKENAPLALLMLLGSYPVFHLLRHRTKRSENH